MTDLVLIAVYLGYAAVWGQLISLSRQVTAWPAAGFGLLVVAPASLGIPGPWATRVLVYLLLLWGRDALDPGLGGAG
jgi:hypothetical protein